MSLSSYNPHDRYRKRFASRLSGFFFVVLIMGVAGGIGYGLGGIQVSHRDAMMQEQVKGLKLEKDALQNHVTQLRSEVQTANTRFDQLHATYKEAIPEGPMEDLVSLIRDQLEEGMAPEKLAFAIRSARPPRNCLDPETKRFVASTLNYEGPDSQITLAEGQIVIKGSGASAYNEKGEPEAWYDPSKSVTLEFVVGGEKKTKKGVMPLHHSIVVADREYRLTFEEGLRSFIKVTYDSCDYP